MTSRFKLTLLLLLSSVLLVSCTTHRFQTWQTEDTILEFKHQPPQKLLEKARASAQKKDYNSAIAEYNAFIKLHPAHQDTESVSLTLIFTYLLNGQLEDAIIAADSFIQLYPNSQYRKDVERTKYSLQIRLYTDRYRYNYTSLLTALLLIPVI